MKWRMYMNIMNYVNHVGPLKHNRSYDSFKALTHGSCASVIFAFVSTIWINFRDATSIKFQS